MNRLVAMIHIHFVISGTSRMWHPPYFRETPHGEKEKLARSEITFIDENIHDIGNVGYTGIQKPYKFSGRPIN